MASSSSVSSAAVAAAALMRPLRVPVISSIKGMGDAVRQRLRDSSPSHAAELFRACELEIVDVPPPHALASTESQTPPRPWKLSAQQQTVLENAQIVLGDAQTLAPLLLAPSVALPAHQQMLLERVQLVQATYAGVEAFHKLLTTVAPSTLRRVSSNNEPLFTLTRAGGIMPTAMAQYVLGWIIALERKFFQAKALQAQGIYARTELDYRPFRSLTVSILGFGDIGQGIGQLLTLAGFRVVGFKRRLDADTAVATTTACRVTDDLQDALRAADFVVSVLPSTAATTHLLTAETLAVCATKQPVLINVGRGNVVAESTLLQALDSNILSAAVLDVFEVEPLPTDSKLWHHPRVHVTPHVSAASFPEDVADVFVSNLDAYLQQQPLQYVVDWSVGY